MKAEAELRVAAAPAAGLRIGLRDALELTKPRLSLLVVLTTVVSFILASDGPPNLVLLAHTAAATALAAGGASVLNQLAERRHDARMTRTADRPLPTGRVQPRDALALGVALVLAGLGYLAAAVNALTAGLALASVATYLAVYTPLKRVSPLCTLAGAVPGALPIVMGWTAQTGRIDLHAALLFAILFAWQLPHFLAIAVLYVEDYARAGFPMRPVLDARRSRAAPACLPPRSITGLSAVGWCTVLLAATLLPGAVGLTEGPYAFGAAALGTLYLTSALALALRRTRRAARWLFVTSIAYLPVLLVWLVMNKAAPLAAG